MNFNDEKVAQMAAYFLERRGGQMSYLKLMKLLYLADRESYKRYDDPMSGDSHVSMAKGPVLSNTLNFISGQLESASWDSWIRSEAQHEVALNRQSVSRDDLDELSEADLEILNDVFNEFGSMNRWQLVEYTHAHCPEWQDPQGSMYPISVRSMFLALGKTSEEADMAAERVLSERNMSRILSSYQ